jgi:hydrogenase/urease accessory protein HupE
LWLLLSCSGALAHDPGLSAAEVHILADRIVAEVSFAPVDLQGVEQPFLTIDGDGKRLELRSWSRKSSDQNSVHFLLEFSKSNAAELTITAPALASLPRGHKQFCSVYDGENRLLAERMLSAEANSFTIDLRNSIGTPLNTPPVLASDDRFAGDAPFFRFLVLGIEHILTGYDHLAFLLALLLAGGSLRSNLKVITSFTVAHSLTLALATLGLVNIPPAIVEPVIAASVVFVGLENLIRRRLAARWLVTFSFGLVHGLGFASALRDLGIGGLGTIGGLGGIGGLGLLSRLGSIGGIGARAAIPLLSFNLGVELAQIAIASLVLPLVWRLEHHPAFALKHVPALSLLITFAGVYWFVARTLM